MSLRTFERVAKGELTPEQGADILMHVSDGADHGSSASFSGSLHDPNLSTTDPLSDLLARLRRQYGLTEAEAGVLRIAVESDTNQHFIACERKVRDSTIKKQAQRIAEKLDTCGLTEATLFVLRQLALGTELL